MASEPKPVKKMLYAWAAAVFVLLVLVGSANIIAYLIDMPFNVVAVDFVNRNVKDLLLISVLFLLARVYADTTPPMDFMTPVFAAVGALFLTALVFRFFRLVEIMWGLEVFFRKVNPYPIYTLVFLLVLFTGVLLTLRRRGGEEAAVEAGTPE